MKKTTQTKNCVNKRDSRTLVAHYSRGNVSLQLGRFVTAEEKEERRKAVLTAKFA